MQWPLCVNGDRAALTVFYLLSLIAFEVLQSQQASARGALNLCLKGPVALFQIVKLNLSIHIVCQIMLTAPVNSFQFSARDSGS